MLGVLLLGPQARCRACLQSLTLLLRFLVSLSCSCEASPAQPAMELEESDHSLPHRMLGPDTVLLLPSKEERKSHLLSPYFVSGTSYVC